MKVFFNASLSGKKKFGGSYKLIDKAIRKAGHDMVASPVVSKEAETTDWTDPKAASAYYKKVKDWTKKAELVVFEVSYPSTSIGFEVAMALSAGKPVIAFHAVDAPENFVLESIQDEKFHMVEYRLSEVEQVVAEAITYATSQADTRFNFFISPDIGAYLDWVSKVRKLPRAVFLRRVIEQDMAKHKEFEG